MQRGKMMNLEHWGWYSIAVSIVLVLMNWAIAETSGSVAVGAETVHNLVDLLTAVAVLIGLKLSTRKSKSFPYGLYKVENIITVALAVMILVTAYEIAKNAIFALPHQLTVDPWMIWMLLVATTIPLVFSHFELRAGQAANSPVLIASAREYRVHLFTSGIVLTVLLAQWFDFPLDRIAALIVAVAIGKIGWDLLSDGMRVLLDASIDVGTLDRVREIIDSEPGVAQVKSVTGRNSGRFRFIEAEILLRFHDLEKAHSATHRIEQRIRETVPHVDRVLIHAGPSERTHARYAVPLSDLNGRVSDHFGEAPYFALLTLALVDGQVEQQQIVTNPHTALAKGKGIRVAEWLVDQKIDMVLLRENMQGRGPTYVFRDAGVDMVPTMAGTLKEALATLTHQHARQAYVANVRSQDHS
jgi:cation diffusion facilitator family transporter